MEKISFGIVGAGWRSRFFLKVAQELEELFTIPFIVEPDLEKTKYIEEKWNIKVLPELELLAECKEKIDFLVLCLPPSILPQVAVKATDMGFYILTETFAVNYLEELTDYYKRIKKPQLIQISEQYWLRPVHAARMKLLSEGRIGEVTQAQISIGHGYHGISLLRKYLGVEYEPCKIKAWEFKNPVVQGPGREGDPKEERMIQEKQQVAVFTFGKKWGLFDFTEEQYFSGIRDYRILIRGEKGEIDNSAIRYLKDYHTPVELSLLRIDTGKDGSMGVPGLLGISAGEQWVYHTPFKDVRLSDDELAIADVLKKMGEYTKGGRSFYSFEEGCQDQYLDVLMKESIKTGKTIASEPQIWQESK